MDAVILPMLGTPATLMPGMALRSPRTSVASDCGAPPLPNPIAPELVIAPDAPCALPFGFAWAYWFTAPRVRTSPPGSWTPLGRLSSCCPSRLADSECCLVTVAPPVLTADSPLRATSVSRLVVPSWPDRNRPVACDTGAAAAALGAVTPAVTTRLATRPTASVAAAGADERRAVMRCPSDHPGMYEWR